MPVLHDPPAAPAAAQAEVKATTCYTCACRCGISGGSFNTREFFHGLADAALRRVRWLFFAQARHPQNLYYQRVG